MAKLNVDLSMEAAEEMVREADTDNDNKVDFQEFVTILRQHQNSWSSSSLSSSQAMATPGSLKRQSSWEKLRASVRAVEHLQWAGDERFLGSETLSDYLEIESSLDVSALAESFIRFLLVFPVGQSEPPLKAFDWTTVFFNFLAHCYSTNTVSRAAD